jgi:hypothetical protein
MRGGWSHYSDTCEPVDGTEAQKMRNANDELKTRKKINSDY